MGVKANKAPRKQEPSSYPPGIEVPSSGPSQGIQRQSCSQRIRKHLLSSVSFKSNQKQIRRLPTAAPISTYRVLKHMGTFSEVYNLLSSSVRAKSPPKCLNYTQSPKRRKLSPSATPKSVSTRFRPPSQCGNKESYLDFLFQVLS